MPGLPVVEITLPADLVGQPNGELDERVLSPVDDAGHRLHWRAAISWRAMQAHAAEDGVELEMSEGYRNLDGQIWFFENRWVDVDPGNARATTVWDGKRWWLPRGVVPSARPSTSNHGLGLAVDVIRDRPGVIGWLMVHAADYGWSWEAGINVDEPWHIHFWAGDSPLAAVLARIMPPVVPGAIPAPVPPTKEPEMVLWLVTDDPAYPRTPAGGGVYLCHAGLNVTWVQRGDTLDYFTKASIPTVELTVNQAQSLLVSFPGVGPSPRAAGATVGW